MKKLECEVYTTSVHILNENNDNFNVRLWIGLGVGS
jgi:hypothetical protein